MRQYGNKPHKADALTFYIQHLQALVPHVKEQQQACRDNPDKILPTAFVTFKSRQAQVRPQPELSVDCLVDLVNCRLANP